MPDPNCTIALTFYQADAFNSQNRFSYHCTGSSQGWHVQPDGSIHPPSRSRIVQISLAGFPNAASFAGLQMVSNPGSFPSKTDPWSIESGLGVTADPWPVPAGTKILSLTFTQPDPADFPQGVPVMFYRLAVSVGTSTFWDDPKIYNDPDQ